uniref:C-type lectin domain-containing protein n=1 Tax=Arion vulgaris TaxID=1028688 RepID=A0A0B6ZSZ0_9EUPU
MMMFTFTVAMIVATSLVGCMANEGTAPGRVRRHVGDYYCSGDGTYYASKTCPPAWEYFEGSCYAFVALPNTWYVAAATCLAHRGYLAEINTESENTYIVNKARAAKFGSIWIGGSELLDLQTVVWAYSGTRPTFSDWSPGQPIKFGEECLEIREPFSWKWNDLDCNLANRYVCETNPLPLPPI